MSISINWLVSIDFCILGFGKHYTTFWNTTLVCAFSWCAWCMAIRLVELGLADCWTLLLESPALLWCTLPFHRIFWQNFSSCGKASVTDENSSSLTTSSPHERKSPCYHSCFTKISVMLALYKNHIINFFTASFLSCNSQVKKRYGAS